MPVLFKMHFTPTSASWLSMVERFLRDNTEKRIRRGVFTSVPDLVSAIEANLEQHNVEPAPYIWTESASDILAKVQRAHESLDKTASA